MSEVEFRLSELREAAEMFNRTSKRIEFSITNIKSTLELLVLLGLNNPEFIAFTQEYLNHRGSLNRWSQQLELFSINLTGAADELENAILNNDTTTMTPNGSRSFGSGGGTSILPLGLSTLFINPEPSPTPLETGEFVAGVNRPAYEQFQQQQETLIEREEHLNGLLQTRQEKLDDLVAIKNRLLSFDNDIDFGEIPRVQVLENELAGLDQEIINAQDQIGILKIDISDLGARLDVVKPGVGADIGLIEKLDEMKVSSIWVRENTFGCVNHIVNKMPIPDGIPQHAYLWDQTAEQFSQYGITTGDTPLAGSVIVLEREHAYADPLYGHVMYVERVENGIVWVTDNIHPNEPVILSEIIGATSGPDIQYLYFPWHTQA
jgi:hypothetical protein